MFTLKFKEHQTTSDGKEVFEEYDWWKELTLKAAENADHFELRCWEDEAEGIAFGKKYGQAQESTTKEKVFSGELSEAVLKELTENHIAQEGCLKYFTLNLLKGNQMVFSSSHYGYEIYWKASGFAEMGFLMMLTKNHPLIEGFSKM